MYQFELEADIALLTVTRTGLWSLDMVARYEAALRVELAKLRQGDPGRGGATSFIIDIRSSGPQSVAVADALRAMVAGLGPLHADRTAVVTTNGVAKLQARRVASADAQIFTSMELARDWVLRDADPAPAKVVQTVPSEAEAEGPAVHVHGPNGVDILFTPSAALKTSRRIADAATDALMGEAKEARMRK